MTENTFDLESTDADNVVVEEVAEAPLEEATASVVEEIVAEEPETVVEEKTVVEEVVPEPEVIMAPEPVGTAPTVSSVEDGVIGTGKAKVEKKKASPAAAKAVKSGEKVAIFAARNVRWQEVGSIAKGYNIVSKEDAEKWLTVNNVRLATPEEIKTYLG
jgi:hypothetical protein